MGRWEYSNRAVIENIAKITIQDLITWGFIKNGEHRSGTLTLSRNGKKTGSLNIAVYINTESKSYIEFDYLLNDKPVNYSHTIELFPCNYGKYRYYFICRDTGKRVSALYFNKGYYSSRHYFKMVYQCSREHRSFFNLLHKYKNLESKAEWYKKNGHPRKAKKVKRKAKYIDYLSWIDVSKRVGMNTDTLQDMEKEVEFMQKNNLF